MEILFGAGEKVRVTKVDDGDKALGIKVGDLFRVLEDGSPCPYCIPIKTEADLTTFKLGYALEQTQLVRAEETIKFKRGDVVEVEWAETTDEAFGIQVGDIFKVIEDDLIPYCEPLNSNLIGVYAFKQDQLRLL